MIPIFYLAKPKYGGWVAFTSHLYRSLKAIGEKPILFKITKTNSNIKRHFCDNIFYQNINIETAINLSEQFKSIISAQDKHFIDSTNQLLKNKTKIVIHDPNEMKEIFLNTIKKNKAKPIVIRESNVKNLKEYGIDSIFLKHPYLIYNNKNNTKKKLAVATSRVDFDKHTEIIVEANMKLNQGLDDNKIEIYGAENRLYTFHKLNKLNPDWRKNYRGTFGNELGSVFKILNPSKFMIDMSAIKKDGGGSQYTFLEGWDAQCVIILNKKWDLGNNNIMKSNKNCIFVEDSNELKKILESKNNLDHLTEQGLENLKMFDGRKIAKDYLNIINLPV